MRDLSEEYRKAESVFLQKNRKLFEPYIESTNDEITEDQLTKDGNKETTPMQTNEELGCCLY